MSDFQKIYSSLNNKQQEAVDTIYGPVLVLAGPGSGKTQLLAARIANILVTTDNLPSNILCLTFTEAAAKNMRERLISMIGHEAYRVAIHTFHSFGNEIINRYRYHFREYDEAKNIDEITASRILDTILTELPWNDPYKPGLRASDTIKDILGRIGELKKGGLTAEHFQSILEQNKITLDALSSVLAASWKEIDRLGQKKAEKEMKINIFREFTIKVKELHEIGEKSNVYESLGSVIMRSLEEALEKNIEDGKTTFMNKWRDAWTMKRHDGVRVWKESEKLKRQYSLAHIYAVYTRTLRENGYIDFSDMILRAIELVENDEMVRANLAEQYQFILLDEYQDTNEAQMRLVHSILSVNTESPNIFAVGDDDQSIFKFQGANTKNLRDFCSNWPDMKLIVLEENYRSYEEIIFHSRKVLQSQAHSIADIFEGVTKTYLAKRGSGGHIKKKRFENEGAETAWIIADIEAKIKSGIPKEEIAIITRKNKTLEPIAKGLLSKGIAINIGKEESIFENEEIIIILTILKYLESLKGRYNEERSDLLVEILAHPCWKIPRLTLWNISKKIYHGKKDETKSWIETLRNDDERTLREFAHFMIELALLSHTTRLEDIIDAITGANSLSIPNEYDEEGLTNILQIDIFSHGVKTPYTSPIYNYYFGQIFDHKGTNIYGPGTEQSTLPGEIDHNTKKIGNTIASNSYILYAKHLTNMRKLIESIRGYKNGKSLLTLTDAAELLELIETYDIRIEASHLIGDEKNAVNLLTVYKAKGLEWRHVYVPVIVKKEYKLGKITGSTLPKNLPLEAEKDDEQDVERMIYTAFTRAKDELAASYARTDIEERSNEPVPCIEAESDEWEEVTTLPLSSLITTLQSDQKNLFSIPYLGEERNFLKDRIEKQFVMNVTALQNFLNVFDAGPEYFIANNILRFPQAKNIAASYGSAIHKGLELFFNDYTSKGTFMKSLLFEGFKTSLQKEGFPQDIERSYLARGEENLEALYDELAGRSYGQLFLEKDFRTDGGGVFLGDIQITGKIDRIEKLSDGTLVVTDYKTGSGFDTFDGRGTEYMKLKQWKYRLQLAFYAILFELSPRWRIFDKKQYELFFVEKDTKEGKFHRLTEFVHVGEIERTKRLIMAVTAKIRTLDFPDISIYEKNIEGVRQFEADLLSGQI